MDAIISTGLVAFAFGAGVTYLLLKMLDKLK